MFTTALLLLTLASAEELTLRQALARSLGDNLELAIERIQRDQAAWAVVRAGSTFDPVLSVSSDVGGARSPSNNILDGAEFVSTSRYGYGLGLSQALPTGGQLSLDWIESFSQSDSAGALQSDFVFDSLALSLSHPILDGAGPVAALAGVTAARREQKDQELAWRSALEDHVLSVSDAYWSLVSAEESLVLATGSVDIARTQLAETLERQGEGFAGSGDVLQVRRALGAAEGSLVVSRAARDAAHDRLRRVLGVPLQDGVHFEPIDRPAVPETVPAREDVLASARTYNTAWQRVDLTLQAAEWELKQARNQALPQLSVSGSVGLSGGDDRASAARKQIAEASSPSWGVGVDLALPVALREDRAGLASAKLALDQARLRQEIADQDLRLAVDAAVRAVERDRMRVQLATDTLDAATQGLAADQELLRDGRGSTRDVVRSLESLQEAQLSHLQAAIDLQVSLLELSRLAGTLLESMAVPVGAGLTR